jgi:hypothetical protein
LNSQHCLFSDGKRFNQNTNFAELLRDNVEILAFLYNIFRHKAAQAPDAVLYVIPCRTKILTPAATWEARIVIAREAYSANYQITDR